MTTPQTITLTTSTPNGTLSKVPIDIKTIKKIIELKGYGARLYLLSETDETLSSLDVIETKEEVQSLLISIK
jgi:hypothetical protein